MTATNKWYYCAVRRLSTGEWIGWMGASDGGNLQMMGGENDDPSTIRGVQPVGFETLDGKNVLRAPAYHLHDSAYLGGADLQGYYVTWKWTAGGAYGLKLAGNGMITDENDRVLSLYVFGSRSEGSWENKVTDNTLSFSFDRPVTT